MVEGGLRVRPVSYELQEEYETKYTPPRKQRLTPLGLVTPGGLDLEVDGHAQDNDDSDYNDSHNGDNDSLEENQSHLDDKSSQSG